MKGSWHGRPTAGRRRIARSVRIVTAFVAQSPARPGAAGRAGATDTSRALLCEAYGLRRDPNRVSAGCVIRHDFYGDTLVTLNPADLRKWRARRDSNPWPLPSEGSALSS